MRKRSILTIITLAALELDIMTAVTQVNQPTVSAQPRKATLVYNMKNPTIRLKVTKGNIWSNSSLTKVKYHAQNYKKDVFYSSRHATIKATNGKLLGSPIPILFKIVNLKASQNPNLVTILCL